MESNTPILIRTSDPPANNNIYPGGWFELSCMARMGSESSTSRMHHASRFSKGFDFRSSGTPCRVLDGRTLAHKREESLRHLVESVRRTPCLTVVLVGHHPASEVYVRNKQMACARVGIEFRLLRFPDSIEQQELIGEIHRLNQVTIHPDFMVINRGSELSGGPCPPTPSGF